MEIKVGFIVAPGACQKLFEICLDSAISHTKTVPKIFIGLPYEQLVNFSDLQLRKLFERLIENNLVPRIIDFRFLGEDEIKDISSMQSIAEYSRIPESTYLIEDNGVNFFDINKLYVFTELSNFQVFHPNAIKKQLTHQCQQSEIQDGKVLKNAIPKILYKYYKNSQIAGDNIK